MTRFAVSIVLSTAFVVGCDSMGADGEATAPTGQPRADPGSGRSPPASGPATAPATGKDPTTSPSQGQTDKPESHEKLYGTWLSKGVSTPAGDVDIRVTFREEGPVKVVAWSELPFVGKVRETKGPYEIHGNTITSQAIRGGTSVKYWFDQGQLVIQYDDGKTVRFTRQ